jgi:hypothetical protein
MYERYRACSRLMAMRAANDSDDLFFSLRLDDNHESAINRADGDEAVFEVGMLRVEDLELVSARFEEPPSLRERQTVLFLIAEVLCIVPLDVHRQNVSQ